MNINQITASIGRYFSKEQDILDPLVKQPKKVKSDETGYVVKMIFDIPQDNIYFRLFTKLTANSAREFNYFGNNSRSGFQYYVVRETDSLYYILSTFLSDLYQVLIKQNKQKSLICNLINKLAERNFIELGNKKWEGKVNLNKFSILEEQQDIKLDKKKIEIDGDSYNFENFIRLFIGEQNKKNKIVLVVPSVIDEDGTELILSKLPDYEEVVINENNLGTVTKDNVELIKGIERVCHLCGDKKEGVSSSYSTKFSGSGINKIFTTTTINASVFNKKYSYDDNYGMCKSCYNDLLTGEKIISSNFRSRIAGEDVFILPEGLMVDFDYTELEKIKSDIDLAFSLGKAQDWLDNISDSYEDEMKYYNINFIFYRSDGNSLTVIETIEDIPFNRFIYVSDIIGENREGLQGHINSFGLGSIYSIVPVRTNKKGVQLDIKRVISLYDSILSKYKIDIKTIFAYYIDALEKGIKQLEKSRIDNYVNLNLTYYKDTYKDNAIDFFIKRITMGYLLLIKTIEQLGLSSKLVLKGRAEEKVEKLVTSSEKVNNSIEGMESFLVSQNFIREGKALFYLGALINKVAFAQYKKEHESKPILKKIQFQGMNQREILRLYYDVIEKLRQYDRLDLHAEGLMNRFHYYYEDIKSNWELDEHSNIFYIMAGYSYMIGKKADAIENELADFESNGINEEGIQ